MSYLHLSNKTEDLYVELSEIKIKDLLNFIDMIKFDDQEILELNLDNPSFILEHTNYQLCNSVPTYYTKNGILYYNKISNLYQLIIARCISFLLDLLNDQAKLIIMKNPTKITFQCKDKTETIKLPTSYELDEKSSIENLSNVPDILNPDWIDIIIFLDKIDGMIGELENLGNNVSCVLLFD